MDTTKCISNPNWEAYSQGKLSKTQLDLLNTHAQSCEICADIKAGIDAMQHPENLVKQVAAIDKKVTQKTQRPYAKIIAITAFIAIAATLLFIGNSFLLVEAEDAEIHPVLSEKITDANDSVQTEPKKILALELPTKKRKAVTKPFKPSPEATLKVQEALPEKMMLQSDDAAIQAEDLAPPEIAPIKALEHETTDNVLEESQKFEIKRDVQKVIPTSKKQKARVVGPQTSSNNNINNNNAISFEQPTDSLRIAAAKQLMARKEYQLGLNCLLGLRNDTTSAYYHEALFLSAEFYVGLNQAHFAVGLLQEILKTENTFTLKAEALLKRLKKEN
jgi:hypothetical protein